MARPHKYRTMSTKATHFDTPKKADVVDAVEKAGKTLTYTKCNVGEWNELREWNVDGVTVERVLKGTRPDYYYIFDILSERFPNSFEAWPKG